MGDPELIALKNLRKELLIKACNLLEKLKKQETGYKDFVVIEEPDAMKENNVKKKVEHNEHKACEISRKVSNLTFENIDRKWLKDNSYNYTALVATNCLKFHVALLVTLEEEEKFEICGITCNYIDISKCYTLEIDPWIQTISELKNFSLLTSVMVHYSEQSTFRKMVINNLKNAKYISDEPCTYNNGGILIYVQSPENDELKYLKIQWSVVFVEEVWKIEHYFVINALEAGHTFAKEKVELLKALCKPKHTQQNLINLWERLCSAVNLYEGRDENQTNIISK
ncbi:uncharacterized protein LOC100882951 isoform X2 [Megachile rotundata]|uniref:uncharacterized protein LOC100882951 isoform X2 n=1 Tax=Megachile rotundata TaxID=143995 RepID=UPI003FCF340E